MVVIPYRIYKLNL